MNFGKWIIVAFVLFAIFIGTLVTVCVRQDISLVSPDYYREELAYQDQIQRLNNTATLIQKPVMKVKGQTLGIEFSQFPQVEKGELIVFCPANVKMDRKFTLVATPYNQPIQTFDLKDLQHGMYRARLRWTMNSQEFYHEEVIYI